MHHNWNILSSISLYLCTLRTSTSWTTRKCCLFDVSMILLEPEHCKNRQAGNKHTCFWAAHFPPMCEGTKQIDPCSGLKPLFAKKVLWTRDFPGLGGVTAKKPGCSARHKFRTKLGVERFSVPLCGIIFSVLWLWRCVCVCRPGRIRSHLFPLN